MIEAKKLSISFGKKTIVNQLDFVVPKGEIYGLVGENGVGKTTLLKMLAGIYKPDKGECTYDGKRVYDNPEVLRSLAFVADGDNYISSYTVRDMLSYYMDMFPEFDKEIFDVWNTSFLIPQKQRVGALSRGQKVRLQFMLSLARHPQYLILDESIANLDPLATEKFLEILVSEVEEHKTTILFSSHQIQTLESICDGVFFMKDGKFFLQGNVEEIKKCYGKLSFVCENSLEKFSGWEETLFYSNVGSMYTGFFAAPAKEMKEKLGEAGIREIEAIDLTLQELFVVLSRKGGFI